MEIGNCRMKMRVVRMLAAVATLLLGVELHAQVASNPLDDALLRWYPETSPRCSLLTLATILCNSPSTAPTCGS